MNEAIKAGFVYTVETIAPDGTVVDVETVHNLMPTEGINHTLNATLKGGTAYSSWFVGVYEGNYTPVAGDTMATFPGLATESTAYTETNRVAWTSGTVSAGVVDNTGAKAEFTFNATKTIYGGFISSTPTKGSPAGVLLSVVRFASPKAMDAGSVLRVTAGFSMASA